MLGLKLAIAIAVALPTIAALSSASCGERIAELERQVASLTQQLALERVEREQRERPWWLDEPSGALMASIHVATSRGAAPRSLVPPGYSERIIIELGANTTRCATHF
jgi:hypothetical protein